MDNDKDYLNICKFFINLMSFCLANILTFSLISYKFVLLSCLNPFFIIVKVLQKRFNHCIQSQNICNLS